MVKKIKKYLKFIVCCALIMSLVAPSYAALSASDGSAFVTKAEFDSALADFNARLTTFEAGINSKIDSQVTSYLDRNGIWNGKRLNINEELFPNKGVNLQISEWMILDNNPTDENNWTQAVTGQARFQSDYNGWYVNVVGGSRNGIGRVVCNDINKSGLIVIKYCWAWLSSEMITNIAHWYGQWLALPTTSTMPLTDLVSTNGWGSSGLFVSARKDDYDFAFSISLCFGHDLTDDARPTINERLWEQALYISKINARAQKFPADGAMITGMPTSVTSLPQSAYSYFFIQKGKKLTWEVDWRAFGNTLSMPTGHNFLYGIMAKNKNYANRHNLVVQINSANIY